MILSTDLLKGGFSYNGNLISKLSVDVNGKKDLTDINLHAALQTLHEALKNVELSLKNKVRSIPDISVRLKTNLALCVC
jgi:2-phospho-L-lactate guanylyltransferase (CobY/MobA/RfbA family)